jgi:NADPH2:quinone reductase
MHAIWYGRNGPAREVLQFGEMPDPEAGPGEVRVRIHASGVNPSDWKTRSGTRPMVAPRVIPHSDGAGVIDRVGAGVDPARLGERVWIWNGQWKRAFGRDLHRAPLRAGGPAPRPRLVRGRSLSRHPGPDRSSRGDRGRVAGGADRAGLGRRGRGRA